MTKIKPILTVLLGVLFTGAIVVYSFVQPFQPDAVLATVPQGASFVYKADSLEDLLNSPVCGQIDKALGGDHSLRSIATDNEWIALAAASEIAVASLPYRTAGRQKVWAAVSWVGWRSPWLRWKLEGAAGDRLQFIGKRNVWPIWEYKDPQRTDGQHLTFALTDNVLIACLSENPADILLLLDTYDKREPSYVQGK